MIRITVEESKEKQLPTQLILTTEQSYKIMICVLHAHFVNTAKPGSYEQELNKMPAINGFRSIRAPKDAPSEESFGARAESQTREMRSQELIKSVVSGYQEEEREGLVFSFVISAGSLTDISVKEKTSKGVSP